MRSNEKGTSQRVLVESKNIARLQRLAGEISQLQSKSPRQVAEGPMMSVIVFHEKAGRSQVGSFLFSLDKVFFLPSLPLTPSFHPHSSCRPEANRPETNRPETTRPEPNRPPQPPPPNDRPEANRPEPDYQQARPDRPPEQTEPQDEKEKLQQELSQPRR